MKRITWEMIRKNTKGEQAMGIQTGPGTEVFIPFSMNIPEEIAEIYFKEIFRLLEKNPLIEEDPGDFRKFNVASRDLKDLPGCYLFYSESLKVAAVRYCYLARGQIEMYNPQRRCFIGWTEDKIILYLTPAQKKRI